MKMLTGQPIWAKASNAFGGNRYTISCDWVGSGEIFDHARNRMVLKFRNEPTPKGSIYGWLRLPEFIVEDASDSEAFRFGRIRRLPRQIFEIRTAGFKAANLVQTSPFYTGYKLYLSNGTVWEFRLPLFTIRFLGSSSDGGRLLIWLDSKRIWHVLVEPAHDCTLLLASLAFIHREYLRHG